MSKTNYYNKNRSKTYEPYVAWYKLEPITETLLQFCLEHGFPENAKEITSIRNCLTAIKDRNIGKARTHYGEIHMGKEGFNEWPPNITFPHESEIYVSCIFKSLCSEWSRTISN